MGYYSSPLPDGPGLLAFELKGKTIADCYRPAGVCNCVIIEFTDGQKIKIIGTSASELEIRKDTFTAPTA